MVTRSEQPHEISTEEGKDAFPAPQEPTPERRAESVEPVEDAPRGYREVEASHSTVDAAAGGYFANMPVDEGRLRVRDAQIALVALGYQLTLDQSEDTGIDGVWGPATRATVAEFQRDRGLEETAHLDAETYEALLAAYENALAGQARAVPQDAFSPIHADAALDES